MSIDLTDEQRSAVRAEGNSWVIACPGSGKTRVALARVLRESARLGEAGSAVLALSFSVSAKEELASRIAAHAGPSARKSMFVTTIHGFCLGELVVPFGTYIAPHELQLALVGGTAYEDALSAIADRYDVRMADLKKLMEFRRRAPDGRTFSGANESTPREHELAIAFWEELLASGHVDYPNALYVGLEILRTRRWIRDGLAARYPAIVIDEYQDCTDIQVGLVEQLVDAGSSVFLVGDLFQCVFGFAGADVDTLRAFADRIGASRVALHGTHRCPQVVVDAAERVFTRGIAPVGDARARMAAVLIDHSNSPIPAIERLVTICDEQGIERNSIAFVCTANYRIERILQQLDVAGIAATYGRSRVKDDDWYGQMVEAYLLADQPQREGDVTRLADAVCAIVERFAVHRRFMSGAKMLASAAVAEVVLSADSLPDQELADIAPLMNEGILAALRQSGVVLRRDLDAIGSHLSEGLERFRNQSASRLVRRDVVEALRPDGKIRGYTFQGIKGLQFSGVAVVDVAKNLLPHSGLRDLWDDARKLYVGLTRSEGFLAIHAPNRNWNRSMFYPMVMGEMSSEEAIGSSLPDSLRSLDGDDDPDANESSEDA